MASITVRISAKKASELRQAASFHGITLSEYVRNILDGNSEDGKGESQSLVQSELASLRLQQKKLTEAMQQFSEVYEKEMRETQAWIRATLLLATTEQNVISAYRKAKGGG